ncbi:NTP transferase domain-containing protein [Microbacterium xanthum]|uniref:NTP transferase domain-containing protein n=1 Tax=Microbacterium xanthum TaxID=3079794 RepID=UPI002AD5846C|nr:NTP transferase domain-containing protein [Microbacterium sp. KSW-48]MDZ8171839.1 NTP transferase domain-containing protein [Microbacterium sp. KSW-48]
MSPSLDAIVLAGGRSTRFGADKCLAVLDGETLLQRVVDAAHDAGAGRVVVVGPERPLRAHPPVIWRRERPAFAGPAAAISAGVDAVGAEEVVVLACDLRHPRAAVAALGAVPEDADAVVPIDDAGREQWLAARYRTDALRDAVRVRGDLTDASVGSLMRTMACTAPRVPPDHVSDVDTRGDLHEAGGRAHGARGTEDDMADSPTHLTPEDLDTWVAAMRDRFDLESDAVPTAEVLGLARDAAHAIARPAAPLATFVAGFVAAREGGTRADIAEALAALSELADDWEGQD